MLIKGKTWCIFIEPSGRYITSRLPYWLTKPNDGHSIPSINHDTFSFFSLLISFLWVTHYRSDSLQRPIHKSKLMAFTESKYFFKSNTCNFHHQRPDFQPPNERLNHYGLLQRKCKAGVKKLELQTWANLSPALHWFCHLENVNTIQ